MKQITLFLFILSAMTFAPAATGAGEKKDDKPPYCLTDEELDRELGVDKETKTPEAFVWVVYFHRVPGCDTCQLMSKYVYEAVDARFKDDTKIKEIVLRYRNFEDEKNAGLVKKLKIQSPSLAIVIVKDGKMSKAKLAGKIWSLAKDKDEFVDYVESEIKSYKKEIEENGK